MTRVTKVTIKRRTNCVGLSIAGSSGEAEAEAEALNGLRVDRAGLGGEKNGGSKS